MEGIPITRLPTHRPPTHPGEMLDLDLLQPLGISRAGLARAIRVSRRRVDGIVRQERAVTADTALRLARYFGTSADFWMDLQQRWDLYHALHSPQAREIESIRPLERVSWRRWATVGRKTSRGMPRGGQTGRGR